MQQSSNKRIVKNTIVLYIRMGIILFVGLFSSRIILKNLGAVDYGLYNVVGGVISLMNFLTASLAMGYDRFLNTYMGKDDFVGYQKTFSAALGIQSLLCILLIILGESVGLWFLNTQMTIPPDRMIAANVIYQIAIINFILGLFTSPLLAVIMSHERMSIYAFVGVLVSISKLLIAFVIGFYDIDRLILYGILICSMDTMVFFIYLVMVKRIDHNLSFRPIYKREVYKSIVGFSGWNLLGTLAHTLKENGVNVLLNMFFGPTVNAARGLSYQVLGGVESLYTNFQSASRPQIIKKYASGNFGEMFNLFYLVSRLSFMLLWILAFPIMMSTDIILSLWLGNTVPELTSIFVKIVLATSLVGVFGMPMIAIVHATGKMKTFQIVNGFLSLIIVPIVYVLFKIGCPPVSAFYVTLTVSLLILLARMIIMKKLVAFSIKNYLMKVMLYCFVVVLCSIMLSFVTQLFVQNEIVNLILYSLIAIIAVLLFGIKKSEYGYLNRLIRKK